MAAWAAAGNQALPSAIKNVKERQLKRIARIACSPITGLGRAVYAGNGIPRRRSVQFHQPNGRTRIVPNAQGKAHMADSVSSLEMLFLEIARHFDIGEQHCGALLKFVGESLDQFHPNRKIKSAPKQQTDLRNELERVSKAEQYLSQAISGLSALARDRLWHPLWEMPNRLPNLIGFATFPPATDFPEETAFSASLAAFRKRIETRLEELRAVEDKGGQPENTGLRIWVARARDFWEQTLGRKFAYQYVKGSVHKGEAFVFCSFILQRIAPDVTDAELATAIRAMIKPMKVTFRMLPPRESR